MRMVPPPERSGLPRQSPDARGRSQWRSSRVGVIGLVLFSLLGSGSGVAGILGFASAFLLATALWILIRGRSWVGVTGRAAGGLVLLIGAGIAAAAVLVSGSVEGSVSRQPGPATASRPSWPSAISEGPTTTPSMSVVEPTPAPARTAQPGTALVTASELLVKGRAPKTGYTRSMFGDDWVDVDRNGCDTRNDILARDLTGVTFKPGARNCVVLVGTLLDAYTGASVSFVRGSATSNQVQIDHVVALSDAWQKGAQQWDGRTRIAFANDPLNLLAVAAGTNQAKGDGDTATWLPPNKGYRCGYVARQVAVKHAYALWVTQSEKDAMVRILSTCPGQPLPTTGTPVPDAIPVPPSMAPGGAGSVFFPSCAEARAAGVAPLRVGDPGYRTPLDGDLDGIACG